MRILQPLGITSRLLPGITIGGATISLEYAHITSDGRQAYRWYIDNGNEHRQDFCGTDLYSGVGGGTLQAGLESLLSFLGAFAESWRYSGAEGENSGIFPAGLADWAMENSDEFSMLGCELSKEDLIIENLS